MDEANRINREGIQVGQRAYVTFPFASDPKDLKVMRIAGDDGKTQAWRFYLPIENTGNTPAKQTRINVNFQAIEGNAGLADDFAYPDYAGKDDNPLSLGAKTTYLFSYLWR